MLAGLRETAELGRQEGCGAACLPALRRPHLFEQGAGWNRGRIGLRASWDNMMNGVLGRGHRCDARPDADDGAAPDSDALFIGEAWSRFL